MYVPLYDAILIAAGEDFEGAPQLVFFDQQDLTACADIAIFSDSVDELPETFSVSLGLPPILGLIAGPQTNTVVTIVQGTYMYSVQ